MVDIALSLMVFWAGGRSLARAMASPRPPFAMATGAARSLRRRFPDLRRQQQPGQPHQVVGGGHQVTRQASTVQPTVAGAGETAQRLHPPTDLLHPLAPPPAGPLAQMPGGGAR